MSNNKPMNLNEDQRKQGKYFGDWILRIWIYINKNFCQKSKQLKKYTVLLINR